MVLRDAILAGRVDEKALLDSGPLTNLLNPGSDILVPGEAQQLLGIVEDGNAAHPREPRNVSNGIVVASDVGPVGEVLVEHVEQALRLLCVALDAVLDLLRRILEEVAELAKVRRCALQEEEPVQSLHSRRALRQQLGVVLLCQVKEDVARLEHLHWLTTRALAVEQRRDLAVGVEVDEAARELVSLHNVDEVGVVLDDVRAELLEKNGDLLAVGRGEGVELDGVLSAGQLPLLARACRGRVDLLE
mmetsp:Transcript_14551/g.57151  ORF Transcript_14551/g.57151 Transcript_14551/m.57151 type:complete len:246 (+) Transcript_14551:55-792(+)